MANYKKLYFFNPKYDDITRTFSGIINFDDGAYKGAVIAEYTLVFSDDLRCTIDGNIVLKNLMGSVVE